MTQERFSTLEECCEFAVQFSKLTPKKKLEQKDNVVAMHIALTKCIDEIVNRVCTRHGLECQLQMNYGWKRSLGRGGYGKITLNAAIEPSGVEVAHRRCKRRLLKWELARRFSTRLLGIYAATNTSEA